MHMVKPAIENYKQGVTKGETAVAFFYRLSDG